MISGEQTRGEFRFSGGGVEIVTEVSRADFEAWIANELRRIEAAMDTALAKVGVGPEAIDRVFLTGGSSSSPPSVRFSIAASARSASRSAAS